METNPPNNDVSDGKHKRIFCEATNRPSGSQYIASTTTTTITTLQTQSLQSYIRNISNNMANSIVCGPVISPLHSPALQGCDISTTTPTPSTSNPGRLSDIFGPMIFDALQAFLFCLGVKGEITFVSENVFSYLGMRQCDLRGRSIYEIIHSNDHGVFNMALAHFHGCAAEVSTSQYPADNINNEKPFKVHMLVKEKGSNVPPSYQLFACTQIPINSEYITQSNNDTAIFSIFMVKRYRKPDVDVRNVKMFKLLVDVTGVIVAYYPCQLVNSQLDAYLKTVLVIGSSLLNISHPEERQCLHTQIEEAWCRGTTENAVVRLIFGEQTWMTVTMNLESALNRVEGVIITLTICRDNVSDDLAAFCGNQLQQLGTRLLGNSNNLSTDTVHQQQPFKKFKHEIAPRCIEQIASFQNCEAPDFKPSLVMTAQPSSGPEVSNRHISKIGPHNNQLRARLALQRQLQLRCIASNAAMGGVTKMENSRLPCTYESGNTIQKKNFLLDQLISKDMQITTVDVGVSTTGVSATPNKSNSVGTPRSHHDPNLTFLLQQSSTDTANMRKDPSKIVFAKEATDIPGTSWTQSTPQTLPSQISCPATIQETDNEEPHSTTNGLSPITVSEMSNDCDSDFLSIVDQFIEEQLGRQSDLPMLPLTMPITCDQSEATDKPTVMVCDSTKYLPSKNASSQNPMSFHMIRKRRASEPCKRLQADTVPCSLDSDPHFRNLLISLSTSLPSREDVLFAQGLRDSIGRSNSDQRESRVRWMSEVSTDQFHNRLTDKGNAVSRVECHTSATDMRDNVNDVDGKLNTRRVRHVVSTQSSPHQSVSPQALPHQGIRSRMLQHEVVSSQLSQHQGVRSHVSPYQGVSRHITQQGIPSPQHLNTGMQPTMVSPKISGRSIESCCNINDTAVQFQSKIANEQAAVLFPNRERNVAISNCSRAWVAQQQGAARYAPSYPVDITAADSRYVAIASNATPNVSIPKVKASNTTNVKQLILAKIAASQNPLSRLHIGGRHLASGRGTALPRYPPPAYNNAKTRIQAVAPATIRSLATVGCSTDPSGGGELIPPNEVAACSRVSHEALMAAALAVRQPLFPPTGQTTTADSGAVSERFAPNVTLQINPNNNLPALAHQLLKRLAKTQPRSSADSGRANLLQNLLQKSPDT